MKLKVVPYGQEVGGQLADLEYLDQVLTSHGQVCDFHNELPDELMRQLSPLLTGDHRSYLEALKRYIESSDWQLINTPMQATYRSAAYSSHHSPITPLQTSKQIVSDTLIQNTVDQREDFEYCFELSCSMADFKKHVGWDIVLSAEEDDARNISWKESVSPRGNLQQVTTKTNSPRKLYTQSAQLAAPISFSSVSPVEKGTSKPKEAIMPIMPAVQFGDRLGLVTQGYYYHFRNSRLVQEYKIFGEGNCRFCLTYSDENTLSDELRPTTMQSAIPVYWKLEGSECKNQHLLYLPEKMSSEQFQSLNKEWLDERGIALNLDELLRVGRGSSSSSNTYHDPTQAVYEHPGRLLHGSSVVALNDSSSVASGIPIINLRPEKVFRIGVFFDGTGNNDRNDVYKEQRGNKSRTNVARLFAAYPQIKGESTAIYVSGIGTVDIEDPSQIPEIVDNQLDETKLEQAFGVNLNQLFLGDFYEAMKLQKVPLFNYIDGENGAFYKWQSLLTQLKSTLVGLSQKGMYDDITHIAFDVIGFSRGAALSRHFVNAVYDGIPDYSSPASDVPIDGAVVPNLLADESNTLFSKRGGYETDKSRGVSVRFLGLFDTVASFYLAGNDDEGNFKQGIEPTMVNTALQIVAAHEYRRNFPLTSLASNQQQWLPNNFHEEVFPGCHADIGGGYPSILQYGRKDLPPYVGFPVEESYNRELVKTEPFSIPYRGGGYEQSPEVLAVLKDKSETWQKLCFESTGRYGEVKLYNWTLYYFELRPVSGALAGVTLERMKQQGQVAGIDWFEDDYQDSLTPDYIEDTHCRDLWESLRNKQLGSIARDDWLDGFESWYKDYLHRPHDKVINLPYKTLYETVVNSVTFDGKDSKELKRNIWDNE